MGQDQGKRVCTLCHPAPTILSSFPAAWGGQRLGWHSQWEGTSLEGAWKAKPGLRASLSPRVCGHWCWHCWAPRGWRVAAQWEKVVGGLEWAGRNQVQLMPGQGRKSRVLVPVPGSRRVQGPVGPSLCWRRPCQWGPWAREAGDPSGSWGHHGPGSAPLAHTVCSCSHPQQSSVPAARDGARGRSRRARPKEQTEQHAHENISLLFPPHHVLMADKTQS